MTAPDPWQGALDRLAAEGLSRTLTAQPSVGGKFRKGHDTVLNFSSNDYLDLATDAGLKAAACEAIESWGTGATASRLMAGHLDLHDRVEARLAALTGKSAALIFGSGFLTNLGVLSAVAGRGDTIFADRLNHASLIDGALLSRADFVRYRHNDMAHLGERLKKDRPGRAIIVSDTLFSMDGDMAPLADLCALADRHDALLILDEAHAIGVFGSGGGGIAQAQGLTRPDIIVGTLSKALGSYGGFAAGGSTLKQFLVNSARPFIYSTGLPPACLAAANATLDRLGGKASSGHPMPPGERLLQRAGRFRSLLKASGFETGGSASQIIPIHIGGNREALKLAESLRQKNILATAIRPPTVPAGTARIRLSVTLAHTDEDLARTAETLTLTARKMGLLK